MFSPLQLAVDAQAPFDIHFKPIVDLPLVDISTLEEDEDEVFKM